MIFTNKNILLETNCTTRDLIARKDFSSLRLPTQTFRQCLVTLTNLFSFL